MPKDTTPTGFVNPEKHNQGVAQQLLKQDLINAPAETGPAGDALDKLAAEASEKHGSENPPGIEKKVVPEPKPDPDPKAKAKVDEGTPPPKKADEGTPPPADEVKAKADAEAKAKSETEAKESADKFFKDSPGLPPGSSPKASEAFSGIKIKAAQEISARETEIEKLKKEKAELEKKLENPVPPEVTTELEDHRKWRAKLDVEHDPKFKTFDKTVTEAQDFIYAQLKRSPVVTPEVLAEIKKHGGPENVNLGKLFESIQDPTMQRLVESKVADIEMAKYQKEQAIKLAKDNITQYVEDRRKQVATLHNSHTTATQQRMEPLLKQLEWTAEKAVDPKADEATRKAAEDHNQFVTTTKQQLAAALQDDSAEMRAILLVGMAQLFNVQRQNASMKTELDAAKKSLAEISEKYDKVKSSSTTRLRESGAPAGGVATVKPADQFNTHATDALDKLAKQVMEERAAKAT